MKADKHKWQWVTNLITILLLGAFQTVAKADPAGKIPEPPAGQVYLGIVTNTKLPDFNNAMGKKHAIYCQYANWANKPGDFVRIDPTKWEKIYDEGAVMHLAWRPRYGDIARDHPTQMRPGQIADGDFDWYIRDCAKVFAKWGKPIFLRFAWEFNGKWMDYNGIHCSNSAADFVLMWKHVHGIFEEEGATNVTWIWLCSAESIPHQSWNEVKKYYPGDQYVDWLGIDGFNSIRELNTWRTFATVLSGRDVADYNVPYPYLTNSDKYIGKNCEGYLEGHLKPIMIGEFGSIEPSEGNGDYSTESKAKWITDAYSNILSQYPRIKAVQYFDILAGVVNPEDWRIASDKSTNDVSYSPNEAAYAEAIADFHYLSKIDMPSPPNVGGDQILASFNAGWNTDGFNVSCTSSDTAEIETEAGTAELWFSAHTTGSTNYARVQKWTANLWSNATQISFWVKGDGSTNQATVELVEDNEGTSKVWHQSFELNDSDWHKQTLVLGDFLDQFNFTGTPDNAKIGTFRFVNKDTSNSISFKIDNITMEEDGSTVTTVATLGTFENGNDGFNISQSGDDNAGIGTRAAELWFSAHATGSYAHVRKGTAGLWSEATKITFCVKGVSSNSANQATLEVVENNSSDNGIWYHNFNVNNPNWQQVTINIDGGFTHVDGTGNDTVLTKTKIGTFRFVNDNSNSISFKIDNIELKNNNNETVGTLATFESGDDGFYVSHSGTDTAAIVEGAAELWFSAHTTDSYAQVQKSTEGVDWTNATKIEFDVKNVSVNTQATVELVEDATGGDNQVWYKTFNINDTNWQKVTLPLSNFMLSTGTGSIDKENIGTFRFVNKDTSNSISFKIDNIKLINSAGGIVETLATFGEYGNDGFNVSRSGTDTAGIVIGTAKLSFSEHTSSNYAYVKKYTGSMGWEDTEKITFWVKGGGVGNATVELVENNGGDSGVWYARVPLSDTNWHQVTLSLAADSDESTIDFEKFSGDNELIKSDIGTLRFVNKNTSNSISFEIDDIRLVGSLKTIANFEWGEDNFVAVEDGTTHNDVINKPAAEGMKAANVWFSAPGGYAHVRKSTGGSWTDANKITFWVKGDGSDNEATVELVEDATADGDCEVWHQEFNLVDTKWHQVTLFINSFSYVNGTGNTVHDDSLTISKIGQFRFVNNNYNESISFKVDNIQVLDDNDDVVATLATFESGDDSFNVSCGGGSTAAITVEAAELSFSANNDDGASVSKWTGGSWSNVNLDPQAATQITFWVKGDGNNNNYNATVELVEDNSGNGDVWSYSFSLNDTNWHQVTRNLISTDFVHTSGSAIQLTPTQIGTFRFVNDNSNPISFKIDNIKLKNASNKTVATLGTFEGNNDGFEAISSANDTASIDRYDGAVGSQAVELYIAASGTVTKLTNGTNWQDTDTITFQIKGDGSGKGLKVELLEDANGGDNGCWSKEFNLSNDTDWQVVTIPLGDLTCIETGAVLSKDKIKTFRFANPDTLYSITFMIDQIQRN